MSSKLIYATITIVLLLKTIYSNECVFEDYLSCIHVTDCCRIQLNNDFMCVSKEHLWYNFQERFEERYKDSDKNLKSDNLNFNYKEGQNICVKWKEINSPFFTEFNINYSCECKSGLIRIVGRVFVGLILSKFFLNNF